MCQNKILVCNNSFNKMCLIFRYILFLNFFSSIFNFPDPGQWSLSSIDKPLALFGAHKPLYAHSNVYITVNCESGNPNEYIELQWVLRQTSCYEDFLAMDIYTPDILAEYYMCPMNSNSALKLRFFVSEKIVMECSNRIHLEYINATFILSTDKIKTPHYCNIDSYKSNTDQKKNLLEFPGAYSTTKENIILTSEAKTLNNTTEESQTSSKHALQKRYTENKPFGDFHNFNNSIAQLIPLRSSVGPLSYAKKALKLGSKLTAVDLTGIYFFVLKVESLSGKNFNITVDLAMKGQHGYLSAVDFPLLIFYGVMCGIYVIYALMWLVLSALQWRDLLRIQFWIGAVILLGLMEKAVFYAEYQSINYTGQSVQGAILFAEILSCMKRTLARMLIIIVSLGFGIVKPRLGATLHRIVGLGAIYFSLGTIEGSLRVLKQKTDPGNQALMAGIPLAITDSAICWWVFSSLVSTIRTLRVRRNIVKLQLYHHFTNVLLLSVICSVGFMIWSIQAHKLVSCINGWKELWVDEAYWHFLFSIILFVIIVLWRPTNNNQRYAFAPLLDAMDDSDDEDTIMNDAFGMKIRSARSSCSNSPNRTNSKSKQDEDLKWVEENIPTSLSDIAIPSLLDSDEEIMTAKFERSKME